MSNSSDETTTVPLWLLRALGGLIVLLIIGAISTIVVGVAWLVFLTLLVGSSGKTQQELKQENQRILKLLQKSDRQREEIQGVLEKLEKKEP